jgi:hypothetical protein
MSDTAVFDDGGYRYVRGPFQYSGGVIAEAGYAIRRVRLRRAVPLREGFEVVEAHLSRVGRPPSAFCACELRSPAPFTEAGFRDFNRLYVGTLERWGIVRDGENPVARSNVCPAIDPPPVPSLWAFCYTVPAATGGGEDAVPSFVVAGSGEAPEGGASYEEGIVRLGDVSAGGLREKARFVLAEMERRMALLGVGWADVTATQLYTVHDVHPHLAEEIVARGAAPGGLTWHFARPPVVGLDYEVDVRGIALERVA